MQVIAHRGDSAHFAENTLAAFEAAIAAGADAIELDIQQSRDGVPVVLHDATLDRTTGIHTRADRLVLARLQCFDAGGGEPIPTLGETIDAFAGRTHLYVEIKDVRAAVAAGRTIAERGAYEQCTVIGFDWLMLEKLRAHNPRLGLGLSAEKLTPSALRIAEMIGARSINVNIRTLKPQQAQAVKESGRKLIAWTCNSDRDVDRARLLGADGAMGDDPARLRSRLAQFPDR